VILYPLRYLWWLVSSIRRSIGRPPDFVVFVLERPRRHRPWLRLAAATW